MTRVRYTIEADLDADALAEHHAAGDDRYPLGRSADEFNWPDFEAAVGAEILVDVEIVDFEFVQVPA